MTKPRVEFVVTRVAVPGGAVSHAVSAPSGEVVIGTHRGAWCGRAPVWYDARGWTVPKPDLPKCRRCLK